MNIGRNDPCPCGSGKKYKKCCLATAQSQQVEDLSYRRSRAAEQKLITRLLTHAVEVYGPTASWIYICPIVGFCDSLVKTYHKFSCFFQFE